MPHIVNLFFFKDHHTGRNKKFIDTLTAPENQLVLFISECTLGNIIGAFGRNRTRIEIFSSVGKWNKIYTTPPTKSVIEFSLAIISVKLLMPALEWRNSMV